MKRCFVLLLCASLFLALTACASTAQSPAAAPAPAEDDPGGCRALFKERYETAWALTRHYVATGCPGQSSAAVTDENGAVWWPCEHYSSIAQLKAATLEIFTENISEGFFKVAFDGEIPAYREENGTLWQNRELLFDQSPWLSDTLTWEGEEIECLQWDTLKVKEAKENSITYTVDCYFWYPGDPVNVRFILLRGEDNVWRFDTCFEETEWNAAVVEFALAHIKDTAAMYEAPELGYGFAVTETELTGLMLTAACDLLPGASVEVYTMEYRLKPEDPGKVSLAGGMRLDDEGWLLQTGSMGSPCLVVKNTAGAYALLGETWTGEVELDGGWEGRLGSLLVSWGGEQGDDVMMEAGRLAVCRSRLNRANEVMALFLGTAPTEGQPYTDEAGHVWRKLPGYEKYGGQRMDDQLLGRCYAVFPKELADAFFTRYVYVPDSILLERDGGLYVRQDAAAMLNWDYASDISGLTIIAAGEDYLRFTLPGTDHGRECEWTFSLMGTGNPIFYEYYTLSAGNPERWEFSFVYRGTRYLIGGEELSILGEPYGTTTVPDPDDPDSYWYTQWYGPKGEGRTGFTYYHSAAVGRTALRCAGTSEREDMVFGRGIRIGDTLEDLLRLYPELEGTKDQSDMTYLITYQDADAYQQLWIEFYCNADSVICRIVLGDSAE